MPGALMGCTVALPSGRRCAGVVKVRTPPGVCAQCAALPDKGLSERGTNQTFNDSFAPQVVPIEK